MDAASGGGYFVAVGDDHERGYLPRMKVFEKLQDVLGISSIEVPGGFVGEQECRRVHQGPRDRRALHFAATELMRKVRRSVTDPGQLHRMPGGGRGLGLGLALELQRQCHVLQHRESREKIEKLEYDADVLTPVAGPIGLAHRVQRLVSYVDFAAGRHVQRA